MSKQERPSADQALHRGQRVTVRIENLTPTGNGISKQFGPPIFVDRVAPGDLAEIELFDVRKDFAKGKVVQLIEPSSMRAEPPCPLFKVCGGCQWQHLSYESQLQSKTDIVKQAIEHLGQQDASLVADTIGADNPLHYRNKVQFPVRNPRGSQRILAGYFKPDSHELVNIKFCPIQPEPLDRMLEAAKQACETHGIWAYDETNGKGSLRYINARYSFAQNKVLVTLVVNMRAASEEEFSRSPLGKRLFEVGEDLLKACQEISGVCVNLNSDRGNKILGELTICVAGSATVQETLRTQRTDYPEALQRGLDFTLSSTTFFQINTEQAVRLLEIIYDQARTLLEGKEKPVIVDAFAGVGTMALWLAPLAARVVAIEEHPAAVQDGKLTAERNQVKNVEFIEGTVETVLPRLLAQGLKPDLILLDPPRKGLSPETIHSLLALNPPSLIYVSCNPVTLARDLKMLSGSNKGGQGDMRAAARPELGTRGGGEGTEADGALTKMGGQGDMRAAARPELGTRGGGEGTEADGALTKMDGQGDMRAAARPELGTRGGGEGTEADGAIKSGYKLNQIQPVDLFPQTFHVESVSTLVRLANDGSVGHVEEA